MSTSRLSGKPYKMLGVTLPGLATDRVGGWWNSNTPLYAKVKLG